MLLITIIIVISNYYYCTIVVIIINANSVAAAAILFTIVIMLFPFFSSLICGMLIETLIGFKVATIGTKIEYLMMLKERLLLLSHYML